VIAAVQEELRALGEGLQRRASVAAARSTLELMQDTAHAMSKVRRWCCVYLPAPSPACELLSAMRGSMHALPFAYVAVQPRGSSARSAFTLACAFNSVKAQRWTLTPAILSPFTQESVIAVNHARALIAGGEAP